MDKATRLEAAINQSLSAVVPVREVPSDPDLPDIVNVVCTVELVDGMKATDLSLSLENIAMASNGMGQYTPRRFCANVLRLKDCDTIRTALVYKSGKIVVVHGLSIGKS